jgi:transketolase
LTLGIISVKYRRYRKIIMSRIETNIQPDSRLLNAISCEVRRDIFKTILEADSGHLGGNSSSVELLVGLYFGGFLKIDPNDPRNPNRDRVLIRGHEGPLRYKILSRLGYFDEKELGQYRELGSILKGHEDMHTTPGIDITPSGSLGMLLSYGVGSAIAGKNDGLDYRTFVFLGDGEEQEGNVSEAARHAASLGLDNLIVILDQNKKQLSRSTHESDGATDITKVWEGYGWEVRNIENGNDIQQVIEAYRSFSSITRPTIFIAKTEKGLGLEGNKESFNGYHTISNCKTPIVEAGIARQQGLLDQSGLTELEINAGVCEVRRKLELPRSQQTTSERFIVDIPIDSERANNLEKAQDVYFEQLRYVLETASNAPSIYMLTPDFIYDKFVRSSRIREFTHFIDTGIREQHIVAMAHGISTTDQNARIFLHYGDAFLYRAADQINAAAQGESRFMILSKMSGLTQDRNGKTHQSSGQPGVIETMPGIDFYEPADVRDLYNVFNWFISENPGLVYVRSHRVNIDLLERQETDLKNTRYYVTFDPGRKPDLVLVSSGFVASETVKAAKKMEQEDNVYVRVINVVNPKKLDQNFVNLTENDRPLMTIYNGNPLVLQYPVAQTVMETTAVRPSVIKAHGFNFGDSGRFADLLKYYKLDSEGIRQTVKEKLFQKT